MSRKSLALTVAVALGLALLIPVSTALGQAAPPPGGGAFAGGGVPNATTFGSAVSAPVFDGGAIIGTTANLSDAMKGVTLQTTAGIYSNTIAAAPIIDAGTAIINAGTYNGSGEIKGPSLQTTGVISTNTGVWAPVVDGGALIGTTLNTSGDAVFGANLSAVTGLTQTGNIQLDGGSKACFGAAGDCQINIARSAANTLAITADTATTFSGAVQTGGGGIYTVPPAITMYHQAKANNGASAIAHRIVNSTSLTTLGANIVIFYSDEASIYKSRVDMLGRYIPLFSPGRIGYYQPAVSGDTTFSTAGVNRIGLPDPTIITGGGTCTPAAANLAASPPLMSIEYPTTTTSGHACGISGPFTLAGNQQGPIMTFYGMSGSSTSNVRWWIGTTSASLDQDATLAATNSRKYCAFRYDTGLSDSAWQACSSDGTTASCTTTGVSVSANTRYSLTVDHLVSTQCDFYVNGALAVAKTSNISSDGTLQGIEASTTTLTTSAKNLYIGHISFYSN